MTDVPEQFVQIIKDNIKLNFHREEELLSLKEIESRGGEIKEHEYEDIYSEIKKAKKRRPRKVIMYHLKKVMAARMYPEIFLTPFEKLNLIISVSVEHIFIWKQLK